VRINLFLQFALAALKTEARDHFMTHSPPA